MNVQRLEGFYWVARAGGYARAARAFPYPITAPGVFQQVKKLEQELGVRLFERTGRERLVRTPAGNQLYEFVAPFMERLPAVLDLLSGKGLGGRIRVRSASQVLRTLLPAWLARLERSNPRIQVELDDLGDNDVGMLQRGETDVFIDAPESVPPGIEALRIGTLHAYLVLPARHPLAKGRAPKLKELAAEPLVAYSGQGRHRALQLRALELQGIHPTRIVGAGSADSILALVAAGLGYSLVPAFGSGPGQPGVASWRFTEPRTDFPVFAMWRKTSAGHPLVAAFLAEAPREKAGRRA
ncbi:MAG TPA: LysR family transcriptional regulator [Anaeromyxobacter sp.]|nr:LysR family transcriptional regulator [Anaeromyxobacter sp.]